MFKTKIGFGWSRPKQLDYMLERSGLLLIYISVDKTRPEMSDARLSYSLMDMGVKEELKEKFDLGCLLGVRLTT